MHLPFLSSYSRTRDDFRLPGGTTTVTLVDRGDPVRPDPVRPVTVVPLHRLDVSVGPDTRAGPFLRSLGRSPLSPPSCTGLDFRKLLFLGSHLISRRFHPRRPPPRHPAARTSPSRGPPCDDTVVGDEVLPPEQEGVHNPRLPSLVSGVLTGTDFSRRNGFRYGSGPRRVRVTVLSTPNFRGEDP